jgi:NTE family protein
MRLSQLIAALGILLISASSFTQRALAQSASTDTDQAAKQMLARPVGQRPRIGLALGGGGARGAAHVGVLKVLVQEGVPIDVIAGTSIGSVVGGLYSAGVPLDELAADFDDSQMMKAFTPMPLALRIVLEPVIFIPRLLGYEPYDGLYKGSSFRKYTDKLATSQHEIAQLKIPFAAVCTNVVTGKSQRVTKGDIGVALQASTAVPGLRKPVEIGDELFCDGGLICNLPVPHVKEMGADFVIAVDIDESLDPVPLKTFRKPGSMSRQALKIQLADNDHIQYKSADVVIHPDTNGIGLISRKASDGRRGVEAGMKAAHDAMPEIKRKLAALGVLSAQ